MYIGFLLWLQRRVAFYGFLALTAAPCLCTWDSRYGCSAVLVSMDFLSWLQRRAGFYGFLALAAAPCLCTWDSRYGCSAVLASMDFLF